MDPTPKWLLDFAAQIHKFVAKPANMRRFRNALNSWVTLLVGRPGDGKSFLTAHLAANVSRGWAWIDGSRCPRGSVVLCSAEEDPVGRIRQFFSAAQRRNLVRSNPFKILPASVKANHERFFFVTREMTDRILKHCPDEQWRLLILLARYGGLRCPSEILALQWSDVNWEHKRLRIPSSKTEHHEGGGSRTIPLFPELRSALLDAFDVAEEGTDYIITRYRDSKTNLRTQFQRIIRKAGYEPWPKLFQNLRSTRETELAESYPLHVVTAWIGNSELVAARHYLQLTDEHFRRATSEQAAQKAAQKLHDRAGNDPKEESAEPAEDSVDPEECNNLPVVAGYFTDRKLPEVGLEPTRGVNPNGF